MATGPLQVQIAGAPIGMSDVNNSVGMLQGAISDYGARADKRRGIAQKALQDQSKLIDTDLTSQILQDTKRNTVAEDFTNRFENEFASIYDSNEQINPVTGKMEWQNIVKPGQEGRASAFEDGGFGGSIDSTEMGHLERLTGGVDDAARYSNDVYDQMLKAGIDPAQAEAQRQAQLARYKAPEMSKVALQDRKIVMEDINKRASEKGKRFVDILKTSESTGGSGGTGGSSSSTKGKGKYALNEKDFYENFNVNQDLFKLGKLNQKKIYDVYTPFTAKGYDPVALNAATSRALESESLLGSQNETGLTQKGLALAIEKELNEMGATPGVYGGAGGKYAQNSRTGYTDADREAALLGLTEIEKRRKAEMLTARNSGNNPGKGAVLDSIFDYYQEPKAKVNAGSDKKDTGSEETDGDKKVLFDDKNLPDSITADKKTIDKFKNKTESEKKAILKDKAFDASSGGKNRYSSGLLDGVVKNSDAYKSQLKLYNSADSVKELTVAELKDIIKVQTDRRPGGNRTSNFAQEELNSRRGVEEQGYFSKLGDWISGANMSPKGMGRDTRRDVNTISGNEATSVRIGEQQRVLPSQNDTMANSPVLPNVPPVNPIDASKQQFLAQQTRNAGQGMMLDTTKSNKQNKAIQGVLNNPKMDDMDKRRALIDLGLTPAEVYELVSQGYGQILK